MTNEIAKKPSTDPVTIANNANQALYKNHREWREYVSALEEGIKNLSERVIELGEQIQAEKDARKKEYEIHQDIYSKTAKELNKAELKIADLKSQLQQQSLPVVPECVGIWIKKCQELNWLITDVLAPESWDSNFAKDTEKWLKECKENFNLLALAFITGKYTVEKPQLFYLKHIDMSRTDEKFDHYLIKTREDGFISSGFNHSKSHKGQFPDWNDCFEFTQSDIDSMQTGSYEQIEVVE